MAEKIEAGSRVRIIPPHPEAGAVGTVRQVFNANSLYERRAWVEFSEPHPGRQRVALRMLELVR